jgi:hypothetical protein
MHPVQKTLLAEAVARQRNMMVPLVVSYHSIIVGGKRQTARRIDRAEEI